MFLGLLLSVPPTPAIVNMASRRRNITAAKRKQRFRVLNLTPSNMMSPASRSTSVETMVIIAPTEMASAIELGSVSEQQYNDEDGQWQDDTCDVRERGPLEFSIGNGIAFV